MRLSCINNILSFLKKKLKFDIVLDKSVYSYIRNL